MSHRSKRRAGRRQCRDRLALCPQGWPFSSQHPAGLVPRVVHDLSSDHRVVDVCLANLIHRSASDVPIQMMRSAFLPWVMVPVFGLCIWNALARVCIRSEWPREMDSSGSSGVGSEL